MKKTVLLYNFSEEELPRAKRALMPLKIPIKVIDNDQSDLSVGYLAGMSEDSERKQRPDEEMGRLIVMGGFLNSDLDRLLAAMRKAGFSRDVLKAVITPSNMNWSGPQLYSEIFKEHKALRNNE